MNARKGNVALTLLLVACPLVFGLAASVGSSGLGPLDLLQALGEWLGVVEPKLGDIERTILLNVRLSRVFLAFIVGVGLAASGTVFQGLLLNPLADPFTVGVSSGAALGASIAILLGAGKFTALGVSLLPLSAFAGALLALYLVHKLASGKNMGGSATLVLAGIIVSTTLSALISLLKSLNEDSATSIIFWIMGSLSGRGWNHILFSAPYILLALVTMFWYARDLDLMALGDQSAKNLGVNAPVVRKRLLVAASIAAGACVAVSGVIGFIGLVVPHIMRGFIGPKHGPLLVNSAIFGGLMLIMADALSRSMLPGGVELPVGVVTALIGGPFFCWLMGRKTRGLG